MLSHGFFDKFCVECKLTFAVLEKGGEGEGGGRQVVLKFILSHGLERMGMEEVLKELSREIEMAERGIAGKALVRSRTLGN